MWGETTAALPEMRKEGWKQLFLRKQSSVHVYNVFVVIWTPDCPRLFVWAGVLFFSFFRFLLALQKIYIDPEVDSFIHLNLNWIPDSNPFTNHNLK